MAIAIDISCINDPQADGLAGIALINITALVVFLVAPILSYTTELIVKSFLQKNMEPEYLQFDPAILNKNDEFMTNKDIEILANMPSNKFMENFVKRLLNKRTNSSKNNHIDNAISWANKNISLVSVDDQDPYMRIADILERYEEYLKAENVHKSQYENFKIEILSIKIAWQINRKCGNVLLTKKFASIHNYAKNKIHPVTNDNLLNYILSEIIMPDKYIEISFRSACVSQIQKITILENE